RIIMSAFPEEPDQPANWSVAGMLVVHGLVAAQRADEHPDAGLTGRADLLNAMGICLLGRSEIAAAGERFQRSLTLHDQAYGPNDPEFAVTLDNLGLLLSRAGDPSTARELHEQALTI